MNYYLKETQTKQSNKFWSRNKSNKGWWAALVAGYPPPLSIKHNMKKRVRHRHKVRTPHFPLTSLSPFFNTTHFCHTYMYVFENIAFETMWVLNSQVKKSGVLCYGITLVLKLWLVQMNFQSNPWAQWASIKGANICKYC